MKLSNQKHLFSLQNGHYYLNNARKGPLLKSAEAAGVKAIMKGRNPADITIDDFFTVSQEARHLFGDLINAQAQNVAIIPSTSYGFASALNNIKAKEGGHAIGISDEFPSGYFALNDWCQSNANELQIITPDETDKLNGAKWNAHVLAAINQQTSVVLMSSVHWMNGLKFDLQSIGQRCRDVGAIFIVDGTQSVGALPMDVQRFNIDVLVCATYKWLFGPYGIALAYINDKFAHGQPLEIAWLNKTNAQNFSTLSDYEEAYTPGAGRYNVGESSNFILMPMLRAALQQITDWQPQRIQDYGAQLTQPLYDYLNRIGAPTIHKKYCTNHLFSLALPAEIDTDILQANLLKHHISISLRGGHLRISVNVFNTTEDIDKLIEVIELSRVESLGKCPLFGSHINFNKADGHSF